MHQHPESDIGDHGIDYLPQTPPQGRLLIFTDNFPPVNRLLRFECVGGDCLGCIQSQNTSDIVARGDKIRY